LAAFLLGRSDLALLSNLVGVLLIVSGFIALIPIVVCLAFGESFAIPGFLLTFILSVTLGACLYVPFRQEGEIHLKHGMLAAALAWIVIPLLGAVPFVLVGNAIPPGSSLVCRMDPMEGFFESMSGWTTTGLTMVDNEALLPASLQFWRSLTQWVGGVGVVVLSLAILARPGSGAFSLYVGEARTDKLRPRVVGTARTMLRIYLVYTCFAAVTFCLLGMPVWDSLNHAMTVLPTGGFSVRDNSIQDYGNIWVEIAVMVFMMIGAISFVVHADMFRRRLRSLWQDAQNRALLLLVVFGAVVLTAELVSGGPTFGSLTRSARLASFQFVSALSTTGFQTTDLRNWTPPAKILLSLAMIAGGAAGSTAGGIKLIRLILVTKGVHWEFLRTFLPKEVYVPKRVGRLTMEDREFSGIVLEAAAFSFVYLVLLVVGVLVLMSVLGSVSVVDVFFEVCSAQGTTGLSVGLVGPSMPDVAKLMLIINMYTGRLEIFPVLMLLQAFFASLHIRRRASPTP